MLKYPDILVSNNPAAYGIVRATEVAGHKSVANLAALYALAAPILSLSGDNTDNDAIGQEWYVIDQNKKYKLINWEQRTTAAGWQAVDNPEDISGEVGNLTVNGHKISENPVLNAGDFKLDGYVVAEEEAPIAATDTVLVALAKLEKANEVSSQEVETAIQEIINSKGQPNGIASLDENGKIPVSQLNGQLAHVQGVDEVVTSSTLPASPTAEYMVWCTDDNKLREWSGSAWDVIDPQGDTIYNFRNSDATGDAGRKNVLYRWDGAAMVEISASIALGETAGTAYEGSKGAANRAALNSMPNTVVTGFGLVTPSANGLTIAFTDSDKGTDTNQYAAADGGNISIPVATDTAAGLMSAADKAALDAALGGGGETPSIPEIAENLGDVDTILPGLNYGSDAGSLAGAVEAIDGQVKTNADAIATLDGEVVKTVTPGTGSAISPTAGNVTIPIATITADGVMSVNDKKVLNALATAAGIDPADPGETPTPDAGEGTLVEYTKPSAPEAPNVTAGDTIAEAIGKVEKKADDNATEIEAVKDYTVNSKAINTNPVLNGADILATGYAAGTAADVAATDNLNQAIAKVEARAKDAATAAAAALQDADIVNDLTTGGADKVLSAEQGKALKTALDALEASLEWYEGN